MPIAYLPETDHCVRYVPWARLRKDEEDNVIGILGAAFRLRDEEDYLSATWAEFFPARRIRIELLQLFRPFAPAQLMSDQKADSRWAVYLRLDKRV
ncbi:hypothetical protein ACVOMS_20245 [Bradyrhizobium guangxiense]